MTPTGMNSYIATQKLVQPHSTATASDKKDPSGTAPGETTEKEKVLSDEGRALLAKLSEIDEAEQKAKAENKGLGDKVESFAYGTLGLDHPDEVEDKSDDSYTAGKYLKGALAVGALLLAIV